MHKLIIQKTLITSILVSLFGFSNIVQANNDSFWEPPTSESVNKWCVLPNMLPDQFAAACGDTVAESCLAYASLAGIGGTLEDQIEENPNKYLCGMRSDGPGSFPTGWFSTHYTIGITSSACVNPLFPLPEDTNGDGQINHCHEPSCPASDIVPVSAIVGSSCVQQPDGSQCEVYGTTDTDGTVAQLSVLTGEGCSCTPLECIVVDEGTPDPIDQTCTSYTSNGETTSWCTEDPADHCDSNGICDDGCGFINADFVCVDNSSPDSPEDPTVDNSPCVAGDTRPECAGVPDGEQPNQDANIAEALNENNNQNELLLKKLADIERAIKGDKAAADAVASVELSKVDAAITDVDNRTKTALTDLGNNALNPEAQTAQDNLENSLSSDSLGVLISNNLIPQPTLGCGNFTFQVEGQTFTSDNCEATNYIRIIFGWLFYLGLVGRALFLFRRTSEVS